MSFNPDLIFIFSIIGNRDMTFMTDPIITMIYGVASMLSIFFFLFFLGDFIDHIYIIPHLDMLVKSFGMKYNFYIF